ncbi:MAG: hypothetical protein RMM58_03920 [Chloroflexota bacterium]|nr:hypothetical protein [Dehalococcoidia bacterium]MDW8253008.1 hypothetical protein [Chloroflexota bacterium]
MDLIEQCYAEGWTDGLPVVPPTRERVDAMLGGRPPDEVVAVLPPSGAEATLEKIAANAVMAGCLPAYFPVVVAAVRAAADPAFSLESVLTTVHSQWPLVLVNGPVIEQLGFTTGANALAGGARANATVGRAVSLVMRNIAGAREGGLNPKTLAHPGRYSFCLAEAHSAWTPHHVERGYAPATSTVTLFAADAPLCLAVLNATRPEQILGTIADALPIAGTYNLVFGGEVLVVFSPEHAAICAGMSKADIRAWLFEHGRRPVRSLAGLGVLETAELLGRRERLTDPDQLVGPVRSLESIRIVVAGGEVGGYTALLFCSGRSVCVPIEEEG